MQGDGDRALINVTDTGIGIAAEDLQHIFQKFYRADNSQTRTVGGTGLGLYLVKQRTEAMSGRVWAESAFGEGSTFYVSLPRLSSDEYEKRRIAVQNQQAVQAFAEKPLAQNVAANATYVQGTVQQNMRMQGGVAQQSVGVLQGAVGQQGINVLQGMVGQQGAAVPQSMAGQQSMSSSQGMAGQQGVVIQPSGMAQQGGSMVTPMRQV